MLSDPAWSFENYVSFIDEMIHQQGWYRANERDRKLASVFFRDDPAFGQGYDRENVYSTMLTYFESNPTADHVAMLAALFREALGEVELEKAIELRSSLRTSTSLWLHNIGELPYEVSALVQALVDERLVRNSWHAPALDGATSNQRQYVRALVRAHMDRSSSVPSRSATYPIVLPSPRLQWLASNWKALEDAARDIAHAQQHVFNLTGAQVFVDGGIFERDDWEKLMKSRQLEAQSLRDSEKSLRDAIHPPPRDTRFCLPVRLKEGLRKHGRARPYLIDGSLESE